ncbi:MAG: LysR family transcriptional regulator [Pseudomonadota bacterium]
MDWTLPTFDWNQARAFLATAETGSFSAAARTLGMTQPTLGRQVAALEESLDIVLFERIGRKLELTPAGHDLLDHMRLMGDAAHQIALTASGRATTVAGDVTVSVTDVFAQYVMPAIVEDLRRVAPQVRIRIQASNSLSDLQRREADIAVRHVAPTQPELISRKVRESQGRLFASKNYLARKGPFNAPDDLRNADFVGIGQEEELLEHMQAWGLPVAPENLRVLTDSGLGGWEMARIGLGITPMMDDLGSLFPEMQVVLPDWPPVPVPYYLTTHRELHSSKRIRLVYDRLAELLSKRQLPMRLA